MREHHKIKFAHATVHRFIAFVLLSFVLYGTTAEAAHGHGRLVRLTAATNAPAVSSTSDGQISSSPQIGGECLICQLHHNFTNGLIPLRISDSGPTTRIQACITTELLTVSQADIPRAGRAPPKAN